MTLEEEKRLALLCAAIKAGGGGTKAEVLNLVEELNILMLTPRDLEFKSNRKELVWRNGLAFIRKHLVQEGFFFNEIQNDWRITDAGRIYAEKLAGLVGNQIGKYVRLQEVANLIRSQAKCVFDDSAALLHETKGMEGACTLIWSVKYERDPKLRSAAILIHGSNCMACGFSFEQKYGEFGAGFIEVHHLKPLNQFEGEQQVNVETDLAVLCSNCHSMAHRNKNRAITLEELKNKIKA